VLGHLVGNAIKFTDRGEVVVEVRGEGTTLRIAVRDTGIGVPPHLHATIFDRFTQADDTATRRHGGAGLGLTISRQLVEMMGGRIGLESVPGEGSTFWIEVPLRVGAQAGRTEIAAATQAERAAAEAHAARVLVAEDNPVNRRIILRMLQKLGYVPDAVPNGRAAVDAVAEGPYAFVLMDIQMPEMSGLDATRAIRRRESRAGGHAPIIAVTAHTSDDDRRQCFEAGMDDYIAKPVALDVLAQKLSRWGTAERAV
jgi:CheY-like chemotaxis protein